MGFKENVGNVMSKVVRFMKNQVENIKIYFHISEQKRKINELTKEIGDLAIKRLESGYELSPEIMVCYSSIIDSKNMINMLKKDIKVSKVACPKCGEKNHVDMNYCGKCGANVNIG